MAAALLAVACGGAGAGDGGQPDAGEPLDAAQADSGPPPCTFDDCGGVFISEVFLGDPSFVELQASERVYFDGATIRSNRCGSGVAMGSATTSLTDAANMEPGDRYIVEFGAPARSFDPTSACRTGVALCSTTQDEITGGRVHLTSLFGDLVQSVDVSPDICTAQSDTSWCFDHGRCTPTPGEANTAAP